MPPLETSLIGRSLGHFHVLDRLGRGGMGEVYLAEDTALKRVAIKKLAAAGWAKRIRREAEALAAVNHPNVVTVHAVEEVDGVPFVVMELIEGASLDALIPEGGLAVDRFVELALPVAAAVEAVHGRGVLHRDLKPGNVMVTADSRVKVVDFGLARIVAERPGSAALETTTTRALVAGSAPPPSRTVDPELLQLVARGRRLWNRRSEDALRKALACFQEAIDRDPLHAPAWIGVADTLNMLSNYGFAHPGDSHLRVKAAVERAVSLSEETSDALRALALAAWQFDHDWAEAERLYRRGLERGPDTALTHYWYGVLLGVTRRFEECFEAFRHAEELDPLALMAPAARAWFTLFAGRPDQAHEALQRVLAMDAGLHPALWFDGQALTAPGRHEEAVAALSRAIRIAGRTTRMTGCLGFALASGGRTDEARELLRELRQQARERYVPPYFAALVLSGLGEREETLSTLEEAWEARDTMLRDLGVDPPWWGLRGDPRYRALIRAMDLPLPAGPTPAQEWGGAA